MISTGRFFAMCSVACTLVLSPTPARAEPIKVAVMPLAARRVSTQLAEILDDLVTEALAKSGRYDVMGVRDIEAMLGLEKMKDVLGCDDVACAAQIGGALGVGLLVSGSVNSLGGEVIVQLSLIDVRAGRAVRRGRGAVPDDEKRYAEAVQRAVADLLGLGQPRPVSAAPTSPIRYRFETEIPDHEFAVEYMASDGTSHRCPRNVNASTPCLLTGLALGDGRLSVTTAGMKAFSRGLAVDDDDELLAFKVGKRASDGSVISWTFGGLALAVGAALVATGIPLDMPGLVYGGAPALLGGIGLVALGFTFDSTVHVNYPTWGLLF